MKPKIFLLMVTFGFIVSLFGQKSPIALTFTAINSATYIQLDSIKVMNLTHEGDTVLYWPDTVLVLDYQVGLKDNKSNLNKLMVFQNYPNPVTDQTTITLYMPEKGEVNFQITDILGRLIINTEKLLEKGFHSFKFVPSRGSVFFFTASWKGNSRSIKILQINPKSYGVSTLEYIGCEQSSQQLKTTENIQSFSYSLGDELLYIGYTDILQSGMTDAPDSSETYVFQFATNTPCQETPTVKYEGQVYNTIQIYSQCWLKENLNVGTQILGQEEMANNGIIEKYCYNDELSNCDIYGGLYQWDEVIQYTTQRSTQGICPPGWHVPTDEEWKILEGAVDSQYGIGSNIWNWNGWIYRGYDAGTNLKSDSGWYANGNGIDMVGFSALPGGYRTTSGHFGSLGVMGQWWPSYTELSSYPWNRQMSYSYGSSGRSNPVKGHGFSVRCIKD